MKIIVINGSPKGKNSVTLQSVAYLAAKFPQDTFDIHHVGQRIKALEKDFSAMLVALQAADMVLFSYPVYTFTAPYQLHRWFELLKESGYNNPNQIATQITTSKHFYDHTAHRYVEENCQDLQFKTLTGLSADMDDLLTEKGQEELTQFWQYMHFNCANAYFNTSLLGLPQSIAKLTDRPSASLLTPYNPEHRTAANSTFKTVIITNCTPDDTELHAMIERFQQQFPYSAQIRNIAEFPFSGGCLGCFQCATNGKCIYTDNFDTYLRTQIQNADAMIYAFTIKDHSMGASFKRYDDRQFCNGHRTVTVGTPIGYIINGAYLQETNLQAVIEGRSQVGQNFLASIATNEHNPEQALQMLSDKLAFALEHKITQPQNFLGLGGMKIFRDLIYIMQGIMQEDHRFYKKYGIYDFPHKKRLTILKMQGIGLLMRVPYLKRSMRHQMGAVILGPYQKVVQKVKQENT